MQIPPIMHGFSIEADQRAVALLVISNFYSLFYCIYHPNGSGDTVKEFLASDNRLFMPDFATSLNNNQSLAESQK